VHPHNVNLLSFGSIDYDKETYITIFLCVQTYIKDTKRFDKLV